MGSEPVAILVKALAVVGGGVLGGLLVGWLVRLLTLLLTGKALPRWLHWLFRVLGAVIVGWVVWLLVFGGGGGGLGGPGGPNTGGPGTPSATDGKSPEKDKDSRPKKDSDALPPPDAAEAVTVEVLGDPDLKRLDEVYKIGVDPERCYRYWEGPPELIEKLPGDSRSNLSRLLPLREVQSRIETRQGRSPPLRRIDVVRYHDSPKEMFKDVKDLKDWVRSRPVLKDGKPVEVDGVKQMLTAPVHNLDSSPPVR